MGAAGDDGFWRRTRWRKAVLIVGVVLLLVSVGTVTAGWALSTQYEKNIKRANLLGNAPVTRTAAGKSSGIVGPLNFLVLGSDSRLADPSVQADTVGQRSDTIMLVHVTTDLKRAYIVSIPRDSYVDIPAGGTWPGGMNKINSAFAYGGAPLAAQAVYRLTGIPLDGAVVLDFNSVRTMVNAVGGVRVCTTYPVRSIHTNRVWPAGCNHLTGDAAQDFMRQRYSVPGSDFGRIHDQQLVFSALLSKAVSSGTLTNPLRFNAFLKAATGAVTVDQKMDVLGLAVALRSLRAADLTFATVPHTSDNLPTDYGSAVQLDQAGTTAMFAAVKSDTLPEYLASHSTTTSPVGATASAGPGLVRAPTG